MHEIKCEAIKRIVSIFNEQRLSQSYQKDLSLTVSRLTDAYDKNFTAILSER